MYKNFHHTSTNFLFCKLFIDVILQVKLTQKTEHVTKLLEVRYVKEIVYYMDAVYCLMMMVDIAIKRMVLFFVNENISQN